MTTPSNAPVPAGWYADPAGSPRSRWWDGTQWTDHYQEPYTPATAAAAAKAPEGAKAYNVWIWLVVLLPYVTLPLLFTLNFDSLFSQVVTSDPSQVIGAELALFLSPGFIAMTVGSYVLTALVIFFAYRDWKTLIAEGVPRPFHWAFVFLNLAIGPVYAIGRAVVVKRRTGHGSGVLWVTIGMLVLTFIVAIVWTILIIGQAMHAVQGIY